VTGSFGCSAIGGAAPLLRWAFTNTMGSSEVPCEWVRLLGRHLNNGWKAAFGRPWASTVGFGTIGSC